MAETSTLLAGLEPMKALENDVLFFDSLKDLQITSTDSPLKMEYNVIVHCRKGRVILELGGNQRVSLHSGQLLLVPARKLMQPMMVSTDVDAGALFISDRTLKSVLGPQIEIWNRAMYMHETYIVGTQHWSEAVYSQARKVFKSGHLVLFREVVLSFMRILLLIVCEALMQCQRDMKDGGKMTTDREKLLFNHFLEILQHEEQKRQHVSYYAERLYITPKYLSSVCRSVSGKSPMRWITDSVMEDCYQLLRNTDMTVKEISARMGFPNSSFFGQYFREQAGMTPIEYRIKYKYEF